MVAYQIQQELILDSRLLNRAPHQHPSAEFLTPMGFCILTFLMIQSQLDGKQPPVLMRGLMFSAWTILLAALTDISTLQALEPLKPPLPLLHLMTYWSQDTIGTLLHSGVVMMALILQNLIRSTTRE